MRRQDHLFLFRLHFTTKVKEKLRSVAHKISVEMWIFNESERFCLRFALVHLLLAKIYIIFGCQQRNDKTCIFEFVFGRRSIVVSVFASVACSDIIRQHDGRLLEGRKVRVTETCEFDSKWTGSVTSWLSAISILLFDVSHGGTRSGRNAGESSHPKWSVDEGDDDDDSQTTFDFAHRADYCVTRKEVIKCRTQEIIQCEIVFIFDCDDQNAERKPNDTGMVVCMCVWMCDKTNGDKIFVFFHIFFFLSSFGTEEKWKWIRQTSRRNRG